MLSISQPELDTGDAFDIPSPPPVADNRFESGFSAPEQLEPSLPSRAGAETQEPEQGFRYADVPDEAPKAPIATIPELQMGSAAPPEENLSAQEDGPQSRSMPEDQATPTCPAHLLQSAVPDIGPEETVHQHPASAETSTTKASRPAVDSDPAPRETPGPEAAPSLAPGRRKSTVVVNEDEVYGALYDSLFPQSFTSEVLSSLSTSPPPIFTEGQQTKTVVRTVYEYRTITSTPPLDPNAHRTSAAGDSRFTSDRTEAESPKEPDVQSRRPPPSLYSCFETADRAKQPEPDLDLGPGPGPGPAHYLSQGKSQPLNLQGDTPSTVLQAPAPPVFDCGAAQGTDAPVPDSVPALTGLREQLGSQAGSPSLPPERRSRRNPEWKSEAPAPPGDMDGFLSPTYLSVGSDDGSAMDVYYSAEEDNAESADDEIYAMDEEGVKMADGAKEFLQQGDFSGRGVSVRSDAAFRGIIVQKWEEKKEDGQSRGHGPGGHGPGGHGPRGHPGEDGKLLEVMAQMKESGKDTGEEKLVAEPVQQVDKRMVFSFAPPSGEKRGQPGDSQEIWVGKLETGAPLSREEPLGHLAHKDTASDDARQEVEIAASAKAGETVVGMAEAERGSEDRPDQTATDAVALASASEAHRAEHNRPPPRTEWVDTITQSPDGIGRQPLLLTDTQPEATAAPSGSPRRPAGAQLDPSPG